MGQLYQPVRINLAAAPETADFDYNHEVFTEAAEWIYNNGGFSPSMLKDEPAVKVIEETYRILKKAMNGSIKQSMPERLRSALENNAFVFSGFKTYHSLNEVGLSLTDINGNIKPFETFKKEIHQIDNNYNENYLHAEYNHAQHSAQMAQKWQDFEEAGDEYDLQYRTAGDDKVREVHAALHNITLPSSDPFWNEYLPPNGWNCRCNVVQVLRDKYPRSDSARAIEAGVMATSDSHNDIFRFNAGKTQEVFPSRHPYYKAPQEVKKAISEIVVLPEPAKPLKNRKDLEDEMKTIAEQTPEWFERGFKQLLTTDKKSVNGFTDMNGAIWLKRAKMKACISGIDKLKRGEKVTFDEADALSTLWHEITHNRNKHGNRVMSKEQTLLMEMANEFVSRQTMAEFYSRFGTEVPFPELMKNRESTGYNRMVCSYQKLAELTRSDISKVVQDVKRHLFDGEYTDQLTGLVNAISINSTFTKANGNKLSEQEVKRLVKECQRTNEEGIKRIFETLTR